MSFESVYRVSKRCSIASDEELRSLSRALDMELPRGYREYVSTFGRGILSSFLVVRMPAGILKPSEHTEERHQMIFEYAVEDVDGKGNVPRLTATEFEQAKVFAYADSEAPIWFATRTQGDRLFDHAFSDTIEVENGFFGLVESCTSEQNHTFPYFEPDNGRRRKRAFYVRPGLGRAGFVDAITKHWGQDGIRCSRPAGEESQPHYFVAAIEGHLILHLNPIKDLPGDSFFVRALYDIDCEPDFASFVEPLLLPGGGECEYLGEAYYNIRD